MVVGGGREGYAGGGGGGVGGDRHGFIRFKIKVVVVGEVTGDLVMRIFSGCGVMTWHIFGFLLGSESLILKNKYLLRVGFGQILQFCF